MNGLVELFQVRWTIDAGFFQLTAPWYGVVGILGLFGVGVLSSLVPLGRLAYLGWLKENPSRGEVDEASASMRRSGSVWIFVGVGILLLLAMSVVASLVGAA